MFNLNTAFSQVNGSKEAIAVNTRNHQQDIFSDLIMIIQNLIRTVHLFPVQEEECRLQKLNGHWNSPWVYYLENTRF